jgi:uncharacterized protein
MSANPVLPDGEARSVTVTVTVVTASANSVDRETLVLPLGSTVNDALSRVDFAKPFAAPSPALPSDGNSTQTHPSESNVGIWGKRVLLDTPLAHGDRIELYRPITADAKSARLARASEQGYRQGRTRRAAK